jgi:acyl carrier protein
MSQSTVETLQQLIHKEFDVEIEKIDPNASLAEAGLDSLAVAELVFAIEDHFEIRFPDDRTDISNLNELAQLIDDIQSGKIVVKPAGAPKSVADVAAAAAQPAPGQTSKDA